MRFVKRGPGLRARMGVCSQAPRPGLLFRAVVRTSIRQRTAEGWLKPMSARVEIALRTARHADATPTDVVGLNSYWFWLPRNDRTLLRK